MVNHPSNVAIAANKRSTFQLLKEHNVSIPEYTAERETALGWIQAGNLVVCRTLLSSHSGRGIVLSDSVDNLVPAPLYSLYVKKKHEFRVHVINGRVVDVQQKRRRSDQVGTGSINNQIRNHANGWIYARENIEEPEDLRSSAVAAVSALGLDFGAVDIVWNAHRNKCYVLEVNSAPGLDGSTVGIYANALLEMINENRR